MISVVSRMQSDGPDTGVLIKIMIILISAELSSGVSSVSSLVVVRGSSLSLNIDLQLSRVEFLVPKASRKWHVYCKYNADRTYLHFHHSRSCMHTPMR